MAHLFLMQPEGLQTTCDMVAAVVVVVVVVAVMMIFKEKSPVFQEKKKSHITSHFHAAQ